MKLTACGLGLGAGGGLGGTKSEDMTPATRFEKLFWRLRAGVLSLGIDSLGDPEAFDEEPELDGGVMISAALNSDLRRRRAGIVVRTVGEEQLQICWKRRT